MTLSILTLSKVSFSDILGNDNWDYFDTFGGNFDFDTFKNDTFEIDTFERVIVDRLPLCSLRLYRLFTTFKVIFLDLKTGHLRSFFWQGSE